MASQSGQHGTLTPVLARASTAYLCPAARYAEAVDNPDLAVGFPMKDVRP
jgi:hypothetical protein